MIKWRFAQEKIIWELDNIDHLLLQKDLFSELMPKEKFKNYLNEVLPQRHEVREVKHTISSTCEPSYELELRNIIGRKA